MTDANAKLAELGAQSKQIEKHTQFVTKLMDSLEVGVGNLVDADMAREKRATAGPAGSAATGRSGAVDRQPGAADHPVAVQGLIAALAQPSLRAVS
ncbi:flagellin [Brevundimonas diminuta]|uniref:Flagellin n=1 Tax=Brevundimonas diminuta TaxID=293 RepID=A0A2X1AGN2_BREDI|nr:flagellin [Brevundimonas diminuta]